MLGRVRERVRGVDVEEVAPVRSQLLDRLHARVRAAGDLLRRAGDRVHVGEAVGVLDDAGGEEHDREHEGERQEDAERRTHEVDPEVPDGALPGAGETSDQCGHDRHAHGGRDELLHGQAHHLGEVAQRGLTGVALPVGVGDEAHRGVERQRRLHVRHVGRVERQSALDPLDHVQDDEAHDAEREQRQRVDVPALLALRIDPAGAVDQPLDRIEDPVELRRSAGVDAGDVATQERCGHPEGQDQGDQLRPACERHQNRSGKSNAATR